MNLAVLANIAVFVLALVWLTVDTATLKDRRNAYEYQVLVRLAEQRARPKAAT